MDTQPAPVVAPTRVQYIADGSRATFPLPGASADEVVVYLGRDRQSVGFSVADTVGVGALVTFATAPAAGLVVTLLRRSDLERVSTALSLELGKMTATVFQLQGEEARSVRLHPADADASLQLPGKDERAGRAIVFDKDGNLETVPVQVLPSGGPLTLGQLAEDERVRHFTAEEKTKLAGIEAGAQVNAVTSVHGRAGAITAQAGDYSADQIAETAGKVLMTTAERSKLSGLPSAAAPAAHVGAGGTQHALATTTVAGFMSAADKSKLNGIAAGAQALQPQASAAEKTAGTESRIRSFAPRDVREMVVAHTPAPAVTSILGRTGIVTAQAGDYTADQISDTPAKVLMTTGERSKLAGLPSAAAPASHVGAGGTEHTNATATAAGFMSAADKTKLDGIPSSALASDFAYPVKGGPAAGDKLLILDQASRQPRSIDWAQFPASSGPMPVVLAGDSGYINASAAPYSAVSTRSASAQTAIQRALDDAAASNRPGVVVGAGRYKVTSIKIPACCSLWGVGTYATVISQDEAALAADGGDSDRDGLALAQSRASAGNLALRPDFMGVSGKQSFSVPRYITLSSPGDLSARIFTVTGTSPDHIGTVIERIAGPNGTTGWSGTVHSANIFSSITSIAVDGNMNGLNVELGIAPPPIIRFAPGDNKSPACGNLAVTTSSTGTPWFGAPMLVSDATGVSITQTRRSMAINAPTLRDMDITGCVRGVVSRGGSEDAYYPVQKATYLNLEIECAAGSASRMLSYCCGMQFHGQNDSPTLVSVNVKGNDDGLGDSPMLNSVGYWWQKGTGWKPTIGLASAGIQSRYLAKAFVFEPGTILAGSFRGYFENSYTVFDVGANNPGIEVGGSFANPAQTAGSSSPFVIGANSDVTLAYGEFEGQCGTFLATGAGRFAANPIVRFPANVDFIMTIPSLAISGNAVNLAGFAPEAAIGGGTLNSANIAAPPGHEILLLCSAQVTVTEAGNISVPMGTGTPKAITAAARIVLRRLGGGVAGKKWTVVTFT